MGIQSGGRGWVGRTLISYKQVLPLPWEGCRHRGGASVPPRKGERHERRGRDTWARRQSGEGKGSAMETSRGECPLNSCQVQVVLGAPPHATRPSVSPSQSAAAPEGRGYNGQHSGIRSSEVRARVWVHCDTTSPSKKPALSAPQEPQVLGAQVPDRGPESTISRSPYRLFRKLQLRGPKCSRFPSPKGHLLQEAAHGQTPSQRAHPTTQRLHPSAPQITLP